MAFILGVVGSFGCFVMVEEEGVVGMGEDYILPEEGGLDELVICINLLEDIIIPVYKSKLAITLAARLVVKV